MIVITGSFAFDHIMDFPGRFADHILPEKIHLLNLSFEVTRLETRPGGTAANIAYNLALLEEKCAVVGAAGNDFSRYRERLEKEGIDCRGVVEFADLPTARLYIMTDLADNQIAAFYAGAMKNAGRVVIDRADEVELVHISADDAAAIKNHVARCQNRGWPYIFDPGQQTIRLTGDELKKGIALAKAVIGNDYEISLMERQTGLKRGEMARLSEAVVVTYGEKGSGLFLGEGEVAIAAVKAAKVVDPTGAGDAYRAGLIRGIKAGVGWEKAARLGSTVASFAVEEYGTQEHHFDLEDVKLRYRRTFDESLDLG
jgi:adenosine kinase